MSSAKAALESDTRTLAWEAGQKYGVRVNTISAGPLKSRAASAIGKSGEKSFIDYAIDYSYNNAPLKRVRISARANTAFIFCLSPLSSCTCSGKTVKRDTLPQSLTTPLKKPTSFQEIHFEIRSTVRMSACPVCSLAKQLQREGLTRYNDPVA